MTVADSLFGKGLASALAQSKGGPQSILQDGAEQGSRSSPLRTLAEDGNTSLVSCAFLSPSCGLKASGSSATWPRSQAAAPYSGP